MAIFDPIERDEEANVQEQVARESEANEKKFVADVDRELYSQRVKDHARAQRVEERAASNYTEPLFEDLDELEAAVGDIPKFRIEGLMLANADTLIVGAHKAGKTTFMLNLIRSLATGEPFLGCFDVTPVEGRILFMNYELPRLLLLEWLQKIGVPKEKLVTVSPLGNSNPLASDYGRMKLSEQMDKREIEVLIVDPFAAAVNGLDISEQDNSAVRQWLEKSVSGVRAGTQYCTEAVLTHHSGKDKEKGARGASAFYDWPSSYLELDRKGTQFDSPRYLRANGRDVGIKSSELTYDPETHVMKLVKETPLTFDGLQANANSELVLAIVQVVNAEGRIMTSADVEAALKTKGITYRKEEIKPAREEAVKQGLIIGGLGKYGTGVAPLGGEGLADMTLG